MDNIIVMRSEDLRVRVSPRFGTVLDGYHRNGRPFLRPFAGQGASFAPTDTACFPMVPFSNRVGGNAFAYEGREYSFEPNDASPFYLHGEGWLSDWTVTESASDAIVLTLRRTDDARSPYAYEATQRLTLDGSRMTMRLEVENRARHAMPFGLGFHPYFPRTPQMTLQASARSWWTEDDYHVPDRNEPLPDTVDFSKARQLPHYGLNNCFEGWDRFAALNWPENGLLATIEADSVFSRYMLFSPPPDFAFLCFEPMSHTANGFHHPNFGGLIKLAPGESMSGEMRITVGEIS
ncbi:aldose 1-epimerase [uncultured Nitratireductor sp.]|mgnify:CR=1 FL=1|uniref:aldose 1-epimerase n=1 Tax=uncultured Nitratireductor sp. TaxID=520953 RepID=UPI0026008A7C|nr:aldose 1-epimerase [uncultured Nitratireductor sp.]